MIDISKMKLGRKPAVFDPRVPMFANFTRKLPEPPKYRMWTQWQRNFGMMLNDEIGDCTIAGQAHYLQLCSLNAGKEITVSDDVVLKRYEEACGYNPADPNSDQGGVEDDVLKYWLRHPLDGHVLSAFASINPMSDIDIHTCIWLFGSCYLGLDLPRTAEKQEIWDVVPGWQTNPDAAPGSLGGHCVVHAGYGTRHETIVTWGETKLMTPAFRKMYCVEAHALILADWIAADGKSPSGFDVKDLLKDMKALRKK